MARGLSVTPGQLKVTRALLVFCREHNHAPNWIKCLEACVAAIEAKDVSLVRQSLMPFQRAYMGSFIDWFPDSAHDHEDRDYAEVLWNALYGHWREQMRPHWKRDT